MNTFLHGKDSARIEWGSTLTNPKLIEGDSLMKFDIVVANPPFSLDKWGAETAAVDKPYRRFHRGVPPKSKADYAFITHMVETSVEGTGKVGVIGPGSVSRRREGKSASSYEESVKRLTACPQIVFRDGHSAESMISIAASDD